VAVCLLGDPEDVGSLLLPGLPRSLGVSSATAVVLGFHTPFSPCGHAR